VTLVITPFETVRASLVTVIAKDKTLKAFSQTVIAPLVTVMAKYIIPMAIPFNPTKNPPH